MTTTAPVRKVYDIPIVEPYRALRELPQAPAPVMPIRVDDEWLRDVSKKPQKLDRDTFIWRDREGSRHLLVDIDDQYLRNIINFLKCGEGHVAYDSVKRRKDVIKFLEEEAGRRGLTIE